MYWTDGAYSVTVNGVPQFQDANPALNIPVGTYWTARWANNVTNELINLVEGAGLTPSETDQTQVLQAIRKVGFVGGSAGYSSSATLTVAHANAIVFFIGASAATFTLPAANAAAAYSAPIVISNQGTASLTIAPASGDAADLLTDVLLPGQVCAVINDGGAAWHYLWNEAKPHQGELYQQTVAQSTTTANNSTYTLVTQSVTFPSYSETDGFVVDGHGWLIGGATAAMQQNFLLHLSDGTTTEDGTNWLIFTNASLSCGVESSFVMPTVYAPGTTVTFTLAVAVAGGGGSSGQMAMNSAHLDLRVRNA